jgi:hypothetical protein|tara:strand:+ start:357 stop:815 length:459 start_codon:yes stop_codon:yes gene_type:complete
VIRSSFLLASLLFVSATAFPALAAERVDDTGTQVLGGLTRLEWVDPSPGASNVMAGQVTVLVRLDVSPWQGRNVRIYQTLSKQTMPVRVEWTARGPLLPGAMSDGERGLVYSGPVTGPTLSDTFVLTILTDGQLFERPEVLDFAFEIELEGQ